MGLAMKVFVEPSPEGPAVSKMFSEQEGYSTTSDPLMADMFCFTGGEDVLPLLYSESNTHSFVNVGRDVFSLGLYQLAKLLSVPCVGICRGGQFLNVMNGGKLEQHIENHRNKRHFLVVDEMIYGFYDGIEVSSDHHQEILPTNDANFVMYSPDGVAEVVAYKKDICFQPHPEWHQKDDLCRKLFFAIIEHELRG